MAKQNLVIRSGGKEFEIIIDPDTQDEIVEIGGNKFQCGMKRIRDNSYSFIFEGRSYLFRIEADEEGCRISWHGGEALLKIEDEQKRLLKAYAGAEKGGKGKIQVKAPMPGLVVKLLVEVGTEVKKGDPLIVVEAMKMENEVKAPYSGKVLEIKVAEKQAVERNEVLAVLEGNGS